MNRDRRTTLAVGVVTLLALVVRLVELGARVAHQDEARVAYWAYRYMENGVYWYRPVVHGPFITIVDSWVFSLIGASDFSMRLVVALIGGLLPLAALLFRRRLRDSETVALSVVLAAAPLFVYYSRFYRNDLLLAGFMLVAFGCFVRAIDDRRPALVYLGVAFFALAFTTKENAVIYAVTWVGATALLVDRRLLIHRVREADIGPTIADLRGRVRYGVREWWPHAVFLFVEFLAIIVFFYAPRGEAAGAQPTVGDTLADPTLLAGLVREATLGSWTAFVGHWGAGNSGSYLSAAGALWPALQTGALFVLVFAVVGFLLDRYTGERPRDVVAFTFYWGFASALGYPIAVANPFPWEVIHVAVPLVVPAAVGVAAVGRVALQGLRDAGGLDALREGSPTLNRDALAGLLAGLVLVMVAAHTGLAVYDTSFENDQNPDNALVQYAQSSSEMKPLLGELQEVIRTNDGTDVLYYGDNPDFDGDELAGNESADDSPPADLNWFRRLPLSWYFEADGAVSNSTDDAAAFDRLVRGEDRPPIVVAFGETDSCGESYASVADIESSLSGYERHEVQRFSYDSGCTISTMEIYVDENAVN